MAETPNGKYGARPKYDLEERLLAFTANIVRLADSLRPELRASLSEVEELIRIFAASVRTTEKNAK